MDTAKPGIIDVESGLMGLFCLNQHHPSGGIRPPDTHCGSALQDLDFIYQTGVQAIEISYSHTVQNIDGTRLGLET